MPLYLNQASVARWLGIGRAAIVNYMNRYPDEVPKPAAYMEQGASKSERAPLWHSDQLPEWVDFRLRRLGKESRTSLLALAEAAREAGFGSLEDFLRSHESGDGRERG